MALNSLQLQNPTRQLQQQSQRCDELNQRLNQAMQRRLTQQCTTFNTVKQRLQLAPIHRRIQRERGHLLTITQRLGHNMTVAHQQRRAQLNFLMQSLHNLSPLNVLDRGYAMAFDEQNKLIRNSQDVAPGTRVHVKLSSGKLHCDVVRRSRD